MVRYPLWRWLPDRPVGTSSSPALPLVRGEFENLSRPRRSESSGRDTAKCIRNLRLRHPFSGTQQQKTQKVAGVLIARLHPESRVPDDGHKLAETPRA